MSVRKNNFGFHGNWKTQGHKHQLNNLYFKYQVCQMKLRHLIPSSSLGCYSTNPTVPVASYHMSLPQDCWLLTICVGNLWGQIFASRKVYKIWTPADSSVWHCCLPRLFNSTVWQHYTVWQRHSARLTTPFDNVAWQRHSTMPLNDAIEQTPFNKHRSTNTVQQRHSTTPFDNAIRPQSRTHTLFRFFCYSS